MVSESFQAAPNYWVVVYAAGKQLEYYSSRELHSNVTSLNAGWVWETPDGDVIPISTEERTRRQYAADPRLTCS